MKKEKNILGSYSQIWQVATGLVLTVTILATPFSNVLGQTVGRPCPTVFDINGAISSGLVSISDITTDMTTGLSSVTITNGQHCPFNVSFASYQRFDNTSLSTQVFFAGTGIETIAGGTTVAEVRTLTVASPSCSAQVDLYFGITPPTTLVDGTAYPVLKSALNDPSAALCGTPPPPVDICPNIPGDQATVPSGKHLDSNGDCVDDTTAPLMSCAFSLPSSGTDINFSYDPGVAFPISWWSTGATHAVYQTTGNPIFNGSHSATEAASLTEDHRNVTDSTTAHLHATTGTTVIKGCFDKTSGSSFNDCMASTEHVTCSLTLNPTAPSTGNGRIKATLDGAPWSGTVTVHSIEPNANHSTTTISVPTNYLDQPVGNYTIDYVTGGPSGAQFQSVTVTNGASCGTNCGTLTTANTVSNLLTFTLAFTTNSGPATGNGRIKAALDGEPWVGTLTVHSIEPNGNHATTTINVPSDYLDQPLGNYTIDYVTGGPSGADFQSVSVSNGTSCGTHCGTLTALNTTSNLLTFTIAFTSGGCKHNCGGGSKADLRITKTVDKVTASVGDTLTYIITLINNGPDKATGVVVTDVLDTSRLNFVSASTTLGSYATTTGIWTVGNLNNASSTTLTLTATIKDGTQGQTINNTAVVTATTTDDNPGDNTSTVTTTVNNPGCTENCGGGGGGGGGSSSTSSGSSSGGGGGTHSGGGTVAGTSTSVCFYLRDYLRRDFNNDPIEVLKLQSFLMNFEGHSEVSLTGIYDQTTINAVNAFQMKYFYDVLEPWGHTGPTSYTYILTKKKVNEIYCQRAFPLTPEQIKEIAEFRAFLKGLQNQGTKVSIPTAVTREPVKPTTIATTTPPAPIVSQLCPCSSKGQNFASVAAAILSWPDSGTDSARCLYALLLILIVLYILASVLENVLYRDVPENARKKFLTKWLTVDIGLVVAIILAYTFGWLCLVLPLIVVLILSLIWTSFYPEHKSLRASAKSWYLVGSARGKSMLKGPVPSREIIKEEVPEVIAIEPKKLTNSPLPLSESDSLEF